MAPRFIEIVFRHKFLLLLPIILGTVAGAAILLLGGSDKYSSRAALWVEEPSEVSAGSVVDFNPFLSPAQNQVAAMWELLTVDSFSEGIVSRVGATEPNVQRAVDDLRNNVFIFDVGAHVVYVGFAAAEPALAQATVDAIIAEYGALFASQIRSRAERSRVFFDDQIALSFEVLERASDELSIFLAANPGTASFFTSSTPGTSLLDSEFARLVAAQEAAQRNYSALLTQAADSQISADAGTGANFLVLDEPDLPLAPIGRTKKALLVPPMVGMAAGVLLCSLVFILVWRLDQRIHLPGDLAFLGADIPIMTLPAVKARRKKWPRSFVRIAAALQNGVRA